ncbi:hypothetical protein KBB85_05250 [Patescibacteria group bacterium]|nr:hypothetical protein [Patescibacteria group bacterium]
MKKRGEVMKTFEEAQEFPREVVGGKAYSLIRLAAAGLPVPQGFVLSAEEVEACCKSSTLPSEILQAVAASFPGTVAVRSSAVDEDGERSWAGMFKTILGVKTDPASLTRAILDCAEAARQAPAQAYAQDHKHSAGRLALVIQPMVEACLAGVLFTVDPRNPDASQTLIEVVEGLGESLVSGHRNPRRYYLDADGRITNIEGADEPNLDPHQMTQLLNLARRVRDCFDGHHQDIEWAFCRETGELRLLQSRGITAVGNLSFDTHRSRQVEALSTRLTAASQRLAKRGVKTSGDVLSDGNIAELLTTHPCHMAFGLFAHGFGGKGGGIQRGRIQLGYSISDEVVNGLFQLVAGQPRFSLVCDAFTFRPAGFPTVDYARLVGSYVDQVRTEPDLANYPEIKLYNQDPARPFLAELFGSAKADTYRAVYDRFFVGLRHHEDVLDQTYRSDFLPQWRRRMELHTHALNVGQDSISTLSGRYDQVFTQLRKQAFTMFVKAARLAFFAYARLGNMLRERCGERAEFLLNALTTGIPVEDNPNLQFSRQLFELRTGRVGIQTIVEAFGHLGVHQLEISYPHYGEQPDKLEKLAEHIESDPAHEFAHTFATYETALREAQQLFKSSPHADLLTREVRVARTYLSLRERVKFEFLRGYRVLRLIVQKLERRLGWPPGLMFELEPEEVTQLDREHERLRALAGKRQAERILNRAVYVPPILFTDHLHKIGAYPDMLDDKLLRGTGVTNHTTEGRVVVVHDPCSAEAFHELMPGSVLVTSTTDPAWVPMLSVVGRTGGLVTEIGGILAHGAIYAREMGMAAVLNVPDATKRLKTGMRVRVNGPQGIVEIL